VIRSKNAVVILSEAQDLIRKRIAIASVIAPISIF
jgi:hypothetical protein